MSSFLLYAILLPVCFFQSAIPPEYLPRERFWDPIEWIGPDISTWSVINVQESGILANSESISSSLESLLDSLVSPSVLFFPKGEYNVDSLINIDRNNVIIRGEGNKTVFNVRHSDGLFRVRGRGCHYDGSSYDPRDVIDDIPVNSNIVRVSDSSGILEGQLVMVQANLDEGEYSYEQRAFGLLGLVEQVNGNDITLNVGFDRGIDNVGSRNTILTPTSPIENVRFENFRVLHSATATGASTFHLWLCKNCFIDNIESYDTTRHHISITQSYNVVIQGSYFNEAKDKGGGGYGYGVSINTISTRILVTNNIFKDLRHPMVFQDGCTNSIFSYNLNVDTVRDYCWETDDQNCRNLDWVENSGQNGMTDCCDTGDGIAHGNWPHMNLFEGNVFYIGVVDTAHAHNGKTMFFRNQMKGQPRVWTRQDRGFSFSINGANDYQSIVSNYLGRNTTYGFLDYNEREPIGTLIGGNVVQDECEWKDFSNNIDLPDSLYLSTKPTFWLDDLEFPLFGCEVENSKNNKIPAQYRYENENFEGDSVAGDSESNGTVVAIVVVIVLLVLFFVVGILNVAIIVAVVMNKKRK